MAAKPSAFRPFDTRSRGGAKALAVGRPASPLGGPAGFALLVAIVLVQVARGRTVSLVIFNQAQTRVTCPPLGGWLAVPVAQPPPTPFSAPPPSSTARGQARFPARRSAGGAGAQRAVPQR